MDMEFEKTTRYRENNYEVVRFRITALLYVMGQYIKALSALPL